MDVKANEHNKYGSDRNGDKNRQHINTVFSNVGNAQHMCGCHRRWTLLPTTKSLILTCS